MRKSRMKKTSYVLQVTCDKTPEMNEQQFLNLIRQRLNSTMMAEGGETYAPRVTLDSGTPRVSVLKRVEEYLTPGKGEGHGD